MEQESRRLEAIISALEEALINGDDITVGQIESDLTEIGKHALLIGKRTQKDFYQAALDNEIYHKPPFGDYSEAQEANISDYRSRVRALTHRIAALEGKLEVPPAEHPASEGLSFIIEANDSINRARLLAASVITSGVGTENEHSTEFSVELFPFRDNSIILTRDELRDILTLLDEYKPE